MPPLCTECSHMEMTRQVASSHPASRIMWKPILGVLAIMAGIIAPMVGFGHLKEHCSRVIETARRGPQGFVMVRILQAVPGASLVRMLGATYTSRPGGRHGPANNPPLGVIVRPPDITASRTPISRLSGDAGVEEDLRAVSESLPITEPRLPPAAYMRGVVCVNPCL